MTVTGEDGGPAALGLPLTLRGTPSFLLLEGVCDFPVCSGEPQGRH